MRQRDLGSRRALCAMLAAAVASVAGVARAVPVGSGDVVPVDPATWTSSTTAYVGNTGIGSVTVDAGATLLSATGYLGNNAGSEGTVEVNGSNAIWDCSQDIIIGGRGTGLLSLLNGGSANCARTTYVAFFDSAAGAIQFGSGNGVLTTQSLYAAPGQFTGTGTVLTRGLVTDADLVIDGTQGLNQTLTWVGAGRNVVVGLDLTGGSGAVGDLGAGYQGTGSLMIQNGATVSSASVNLGYKAGSSGTAVVDGAQSTWSSRWMAVGFSGNGELVMRNGGRVSAAYANLGLYPGSTGTVAVDGTGASLSVSQFLTVGASGNGYVNITHGGTLYSLGATVGSFTGTGVITVDGVGSNWNGNVFDIGLHGTVNIINGGCVNSLITYVNHNDAGGGVVNFGANGGTLTSQWTLWGGPSGFIGTGTINTQEMVADGNLIFDATHGMTQTLHWTGDDQNVTVSLSMRPEGFSVLGAGAYASGTLTIRDGMAMRSPNPDTGTGYLGYARGSTGTALINGTGSSWSMQTLYVGYSGNGILTVSNGGAVTSKFSWIGYKGTGVLTIDGSASTFSSVISLNGTLVVTNGGKITSGSSDIGYGGATTGLASVDGSGSTWTNSGNITVGNTGVGTVAITHGGKVVTTGTGIIGSGNIYLGYRTGAMGAAIVDGTGSTMTSNDTLFVGCSGNGMLTIINGGKAISGSSVVGNSANTTGTVLVDGASSAWTVGSGLTLGNGYVGDRAKGGLSIANGGTVTVRSLLIYGTSVLTMNVGDGSKISIGAGGLTNYGTIRLKTVPSATAGTYTPMTVGSGTIYVQALGGKWNVSSHVFTVSAAMAGVPGVGVTVDRAVNQRVVITDGTTLDCVQAGFLGTSGSASVTLTGWELTAEQEAGLVGVLPAGQVIEDGWTFGAEGYTAGDPVFLSMKVGGGWSAEQLAVWHFDGSAWTPYGAGDLSYDGMYASFTVTGFSGYAVTGVVPEASTIGVLLVGMVGMLRRRRCGKLKVES